MDIGIGLPNAVRGVARDGIVEWARRAEAAGFSSLGTIDRIAYANYESLIALAAAAAVTERIRLVTDIMIAPLRANTALLAKQSATIDNLSGGRLVLGLAPGGREDDYTLSGVDFHRRGRLFDEQLEALPRLWAGEGGLGPAPASSSAATTRRRSPAPRATPMAGPPAAAARTRSPAPARRSSRRGRPPAATARRARSAGRSSPPPLRGRCRASPSRLIGFCF